LIQHLVAGSCHQCHAYHSVREGGSPNAEWPTAAQGAALGLASGRGAYATIPLLILLSFASTPKEDFPLADFAPPAV
jgi:hypothetical protein